MKKLLTIIFFLPLFCQAQGLIGSKKSDLINQLNKASIKYELRADTLTYSESDQSVYRLIFKADTVMYLNIFIDSRKFNKTLQAYNDPETGLYYVKENTWADHVPLKGVYLYTIDFPKKEKFFITTIQKIK